MSAKLLERCSTVLAILTTLLCLVDSQSCGIVGYPPGVRIGIHDVPDNTLPQTEIWRAETFDVNGTVASSHPHAKYITALRYTSAYALHTSDKFPDFIAEQGHVILTRNVTFTCKDGGSVTYDFEISIDISDKEKPVFVEPEYSLQITEDWGLNESINPWALIIARDADEELINAELSFMASLTSETGTDLLYAVGTPLWPNDPSPPPSGTLFYYRVDLYLQAPISVGVHEFYLTASSRVNSGSVFVNLTVVYEIV